MANYHDVKIIAVGTEEETIIMLKAMISNYELAYGKVKVNIEKENLDLNSAKGLYFYIRRISEEVSSDYGFLMEMITLNPDSMFFGDNSWFVMKKYENGLITSYLKFVDRNDIHIEDFLNLHNQSGQIYMYGYHEDENGEAGYVEILEGKYEFIDEVLEESIKSVLPTVDLRSLAIETNAERNIIISEDELKTVSKDEMEKQKYYLAILALGSS